MALTEEERREAASESLAAEVVTHSLEPLAEMKSQLATIRGRLEEIGGSLPENAAQPFRQDRARPTTWTTSSRA
jgi:hypothetical protein